VDRLFTDGPEQHDKLLSLSERIDVFEGYRVPHARRIAAACDALSSAFSLAPRDREFLHQAALVHDVGELTMNREYIRSGRLLSSAERIDMQRHPVLGEQECARLGLSRGVQLIVRWHHEWWNGSGYPDALENEQIPITARILRVADTYEALISDRPYRPAMSAEDAERHLIEWAAVEFDPRIVKTFIELVATQSEVPAEQADRAQA
jgi:HD-GYP domain-containing protein (c-di-GMP phosphodiesterase class II)